MAAVSRDEGEGEWVCYLVHGRIGISHVMRARRRTLPAARRAESGG